MPKSTTAAAASPGGMNPAALTRAQLVKVLAAAGGKTTAEDLEQDLAAGAPTNADGTLHLVHYTAWLASQVG
jgi:hypothetical protein